MAEIFTGKLTFKEEKKGRRWLLAYTSKKGVAMNEPISPEKFARLLRDSTEDNIEVSFELDQSGRPFRVRPTGQEWQELAPVVHAAPVNRGEHNMPQYPRDIRRRENDRPRQYDNQARREDMPEPEFHNPYNFVPAPPRDVNHAELGDHAPSGHDRFIADKLSGKLSVRMTVETPLLLMDMAKVEVNKYGQKATDIHKTFPVRVCTDGKPEINPTAIKGMLRSAYEAVTNSRFSVFQKHDEPLAFRMESTEGAMSVPARIEKDKTDGKLYVVLYTGKSELDELGRPLNEDKTAKDRTKNATLCAAWIYTYRKSECRVDRQATWLSDLERLPKHGEKVYAGLKLVNKGIYKFWSVEKMVHDKTKLGTPPADHIEVEGYVCITGKNQGTDDHQNIGNKHDERLFFYEGASPKYKRIELTPALREKWDALIKNYRKEHDNGKGQRKDAPKNNYGKQLSWSRHIRKTEANEMDKEAELVAEKLDDGTLCYARVQRSGSDFEILELYPVTISRRLHSTTPAKLLPAKLHPAYKTGELSPADRVFGWVRQTDKEKHKLLSPEEKKLGAYRGQIRIGIISLAENNLPGNGIEEFKEIPAPLQILGQPKPQQGRFYVAKDENGNAQPKLKGDAKGLTNEQAGYEKGKGLRGRKVYPHHKALPDNYWISGSDLKSEGANDLSQIVLKEKLFREYLRPQSNKHQDNQNRSVKGWVVKGTEFKFDIHFINFSKVELGALIWLLSLEDGFHRFGGGKPLGFGSVKLEICRDEGKETIGSDIRSGKELSESRYSSLADGESKCVGLENIVKEFQKAVLTAYKPDVQVIDEQIKEKFERVSFIKAFMRMAKGFEDNLPIHYPRTREEGTTEHPAPNPEGESFKWFVANSKTSKNRRTDEIEVVNGFALPNLAEDEGLPILKHKRQGRH